VTVGAGGHLILSKIFKFVATRCQIFRLQCTGEDRLNTISS